MLLFQFNCVYFNTFYNAETYFSDAVKIIEDTAMEKEDQIPSKAKNLLEKAIDKCNIVIEDFPESKYVDDAYFIIGKAGFLRSEYSIAQKNFNNVINKFPQSEFFQESRIWLAYTLFKIGEIDSALLQLNEMVVVNKSKDSQYLIYNALGDIYFSQDSINTAFEYYSKAIDVSVNSGKRISVFNKIIRAAEKSQQYEIAVQYLEQLEKQTDSQEVRKSARLKWIDFNKIIGRYEIILQEIDILLGTAEYESMHLDLEMEKARIYMDRGDYSDGRTVLLTFIDQHLDKKDNKSKKARAEAYFILGESSLFNQFEFSNAREYFEKMSEEYNRSEFRTKTDKYLDLMDEYDKMKKQYKESSKRNENEKLIQPDSSIVEINEINNDTTNINDSLITKINYEINTIEKGEKKSKEIEENKKTAILMPDSLLFSMCEMLVFDFGKKDSAVNRYIELVNKFPESKRMFKALYALSVFSIDSSYWKSELETRFPDYYMLKNNQQNRIEVDSLEIIRYSAINLLEKNPYLARDSLITIAQLYNDASSIYYTAYINDIFLQDLEETKFYYQNYIDSFPDHEYYTKAKSRLDIIQQAISDTVPQLIDSIVNKSSVIDSLNEQGNFDFSLDSVNIPINNKNFDSLWNSLKNKDRMRIPGFNMPSSDSLLQFDSVMIKNLEKMRVKIQD